ncbi:sulfotransferase [Arenimonas sp.]|uniref:sulfotransferase family protein n=1 Tax=Arenimonas sp. TaxID=1872635 RepID=UPI0035AF9014
MPRVQFLIGGVQKCGTSALAAYLAEHPQLCLPADKEAHVFDAPDFDDAAAAAEVDKRYAAHFPPGDDTRLHGDATPIYCLHPRLVERIARYNPGMRWIILLRDPVERALSHYRMERARGTDAWPLLPAMLFESWRLRGHHDDWSEVSPLRRHSYRLRGDYASQLACLRRHFPASQLLVLHQQSLADDPTTTVGRVCAFLGVPPPAAPLAERRVFEGGYRPYPAWHPARWLLRWLLRREVREFRTQMP